MKVQYTFKHLDHSEALEEYCQERLEEIARFLLKDYTGHVAFSKRLKEFCVEFTILTKERPFRTKSYHFDPYGAVDEAVQKLEKQMMKVRKMMTYHKKPEVRRSKRWGSRRQAA
jgi:putative sigma-54 modulation protein